MRRGYYAIPGRRCGVTCRSSTRSARGAPETGERALPRRINDASKMDGIAIRLRARTRRKLHDDFVIAVERVDTGVRRIRAGDEGAAVIELVRTALNEGR